MEYLFLFGDYILYGPLLEKVSNNNYDSICQLKVYNQEAKENYSQMNHFGSLFLLFNSRRIIGTRLILTMIDQLSWANLAFGVEPRVCTRVNNLYYFPLLFNFVQFRLVFTLLGKAVEDLWCWPRGTHTLAFQWKKTQMRCEQCLNRTFFTVYGAKFFIGMKKKSIIQTCIPGQDEKEELFKVIWEA